MIDLLSSMWPDLLQVFLVGVSWRCSDDMPYLNTVGLGLMVPVNRPSCLPREGLVMPLSVDYVYLSRSK